MRIKMKMLKCLGTRIFDQFNLKILLNKVVKQCNKKIQKVVDLRYKKKRICIALYKTLKLWNATVYIRI